MTNELAAPIFAGLPGGRRHVIFGRKRIRIEDVVALAPVDAAASIHEHSDIERTVRLHRAGALPCPLLADT